MIDKLKERWNVKSKWDAIIILVVFSLAGTTSLFIKQPLFLLFNIQADLMSTFDFILIYILIVNPSYLIMLLFWGFVMRKWDFFWTFEKKIFKKILIVELIVAVVYIVKLLVLNI